MSRAARWLGTALLALIITIAAAQGPVPLEDSATPVVFRRFAGRVVKVQMVETRSGAKALVGSGFYVTPRGHVITNFHVVSHLVHDPDRYRGEVVDPGGGTRALRVLAVDVTHDLALCATDSAAAAWFTLGPVPLAQGARLYALGHPRDLGLAIVEGTYNGHLPHALYEKIHFTGALNPGMSGGPAITGAGQVVGINVSTAGNELSFLVPVERATLLLARGQGHGTAPGESLLADVGRQLRGYQDEYLVRLLADSFPTVELGPFRLPTRPAPFFNCWGDSETDVDDPYDLVAHVCSTDDEVFISGDQGAGLIEFDHRLLTSERLGALRFAARYTKVLRRPVDTDWADAAAATPFRCREGNVRERRLTMKVVFCVRRYRKLEGLYDAVLRAAVIGGGRRGLVTTLTMTGVTFANARTMARRYLEAIRWSG